MPVPKFYRVLRGQRGNVARQRYLDYLERLGPSAERSRVGQGASRPVIQLLYVSPFNIDLGTTIVLQTQAFQPSWTALSGYGAISSRTKDAIGTNTAIKLARGRAARIRASRGLAQTGTARTSDKTGLQYLNYGGSTVSVPIGRANATDTQGDALAAARTQLAAAGYKRIGLVEENL